MNGLGAVLVIVLAAMLFSSLTRRLDVDGWGIMVEPPHRSSLWRYNYNVSVNQKDDNLNCGGYDWQWGVHQGRCGVCGDQYNGTQDNADHGKYDRGIIVRRYKDGHYINITFEVSSNYLGYVEFRLCPRNSTRQVLDQSCFDRYPLWIDESHGTRYYIGSRGGIYDIHIRLPSGLVCRRCVLQWKYKTGYRYNGGEQCKCLGCGRQEQYVNCADIEIAPIDGWRTDRRTDRRPVRTDRRTDRRPVRTGRRTDAWRWPGRGRRQHLINVTASHIFQLASIIEEKPNRTSGVYGAPTKQTNGTTNETGLQLATPSTTHTFTSTTVSSTLSPSYKSPETTSQIMATPSTKSGSDVTITSGPLRKAIPLEDIRKELLKRIGETNQGSGQELKVFFTPPAAAVTDVTTAASISKISVQASRPTTIATASAAPNTQFVSVSNILERFYPNYPNFITPFLVSITTSRGSRLKLPTGCDVTSDEFRCVARGIYNQSPGISQWCEMNCRAGNCATFMCDCFCEDKRRTQNTSCHAIADFSGVVGMDEWCLANCKVGYCPPNTCSVEDCLRPDVT